MGCLLFYRMGPCIGCTRCLPLWHNRRMDVDPVEVVENAKEEKKSHLNTLVAIVVAILATFMGVCNVKDDNICQGMQQAQANKIDTWSWYQARNIREEVLTTSSVQMASLASVQTSPEAKKALLAESASFKALAASQNKKKAKLEKEANGYEKEYDDLNYRDDQFDLSDSSLAIAIAMLALTALTQKKWLFGVAMVFTAFGVVMGLAGLFGLHIHPDALTKLLS